MRRNALIALGIAVFAWGAAALVSGSASLRLLTGAGGSRAVAPSCLPASLEHSAALAGTRLDVSPAPETDTANPRTQISFLGVPAAAIHGVAVVGSRSGAHGGRLRGYSQGDGASFLPVAPFLAGEHVVVRATIGAGAAAPRRIEFGFRVDTPSSTASVGEFPNPQAAPADYQSFATMPGVRAPILSVTVPDRDPAAGDVFTTNGPGPGEYGP